MKRILAAVALCAALLPRPVFAQAVIVPSPVPACTAGDVLAWSVPLQNFICTAPSAASQPLTDALGLIRNATDGTKVLSFSLAGLTTATTRTWTIPDANLTIPSTIASLGANSFTGLQTLGAGLTVTGNGAFTGIVSAGDGSVAAPSITFASATSWGFWKSATFGVVTSVAGTGITAVDSGGVNVKSDGYYSFASSGLSSADTFLRREAASTIAQRNGVSPQRYNIYNTYTDASNYERGWLSWSGNVFYLGTNSAGTGTQRNIEIWTSGAGASWRFTTLGNLVAVTDNTFDIGASAANRPRSAYLGGNVNAAGHGLFGGSAEIGDAGLFYWATRSRLASPSNGIITLWNAGQSGFTRLQFGCITSSCPALAPSGAVLQVATGDGAAYAALQALSFSAFGGAITTDQYVSVGSNPAAIGAFRVPNTFAVASRNATNTADIVMLNANGSNQTQLHDGYFIFGGAMQRFGGSSVAFPALRRTGASIDVRLADDSGYAGLAALNITATAGQVFFNTAATIKDLTGAGSPEGVVTASVGSTYRRTDGGAGTSFYVKESGASNTGWVAK